MTKIKSEGKQVFNIPNTAEGQHVYKMMKKFKNKGYQFRVKGRGGKRKERGGDGSYIAFEKGDWFAVYIDAVLENNNVFKRNYEYLQMRINTLTKIISDKDKHILDLKRDQIVLAKRNRELRELNSEGWFVRLLKYLLNRNHGSR